VFTSFPTRTSLHPHLSAAYLTVLPCHPPPLQVEDPELVALLASSLKPRKSSKKKAAAKTDAAAAEGDK